MDLSCSCHLPLPRSLLISQNETLSPLHNPPPPPCLPALGTYRSPFHFMSLGLWLLQGAHGCGLILDLSSRVWLISLGVLSSRFLRAAAGVNAPSFTRWIVFYPTAIPHEADVYAPFPQTAAGTAALLSRMKIPLAVLMGRGQASGACVHHAVPSLGPLHPYTQT